MITENIDFSQIIKTVTPYFVKVYGEEYKEFIETQLSHVIPVFYTRIEDLKDEKNHRLSDLSVELTLEFLEKLDVPLTTEQKRGAKEGKSLAKIKEDSKINKLLKWFFDNRPEYGNMRNLCIKRFTLEPIEQEYIRKQMAEWLTEAGFKVDKDNYNEWIKTSEAKEFYASLDKARKVIDELDSKYDSVYREFDHLNEEISKAQNIKNELEVKYMLDFAHEVSSTYGNIFTEDDLKEIDKHKNDLTPYNLRTTKVFELIGNLTFGDGIIDAFSKESIEKLNNSNTSPYVKDSILEKRLKYFEMHNQYDGSNRDEFLNRRRVRELNPRPNYVKKIMEIRKKYADKLQLEYLKRTSTYAENKKSIEGQNLLFGETITLDDIDKKVTCIKPDMKMNDDTLEFAPILLFNVEGTAREYRDVYLIHELNHSIELALKEFNEDKALIKCGFEPLTITKSNKEEDENDDEYRPYTQFSEIINHMIAKEVTRKMHEDGVYIFDDPKLSKIDHATSYERNELFVRDFFDKYRKFIIKSRTSGSMEPLFEVIGEENFEELNSIISEHSQLPFYQMMEDCINKRDTELSRARFSLVERTKDVNVRMASYSTSFKHGYQ